MRLIDADALKDRAEIIPLTFDGGIDINDFEKMLDEMPTVEAIPVEYIESTMKRWKEIIGYEESVEALRILIDNWKIERKEE
ncbi:MAG: hypothetical protein IKE94_15860 [Aeriscardovia sp.]|nr:hypothetical protein [Aeriscardovia sp.]